MASTIFTSQTPASTDNPDGPYTLGTVFYPKRNGTITHGRFYKADTDPGGNVIFTLFSITGESTGSPLTAEAFDTPFVSGWNEIELPSPFPVTANTLYVASYYTPDFYVATSGFFTSAPVDSGDLVAIQNGDPFSNGRYHPGDAAPVFPGLTFGEACYFADVVFEPDPVEQNPRGFLLMF